MDALVLAGGTSNNDDPLFTYSKGSPKSLIEIAGKPLVQWVLDALTGAKHISSIYVVGLGPSSGLASKKQLIFLPEQGDVIENFKLGCLEIMRANPTATHAFLTSSDIPMVTSRIVDSRIESAAGLDKDVHYAVVERRTMESRFPKANRTYLRLRDGEFCGTDMNVVKLSALKDENLWNKLAESRKSPIKQAALIGLPTLFLLLTRRLTLRRAEQMVSQRLGLQTEVIISPHAEIAMDVDKPHQLELLRTELEQQEASKI